MRPTQRADQRALVRAGSGLAPITIGRRAPRPLDGFAADPLAAAAKDPSPALLPWIVIVTYAALWAVTLVDFPVVGRIEKPLVILGIVAIPFALNASRLVTAAPPLMVGVGLVGVLVSYTTSFLINPPAFDGSDFVLGLTGRIIFLWVGYVLLQNRKLLREAFWLLAMSAVAAAAFAVFLMFRNGIGFGRISGNDLLDLIGPASLAIFVAVQPATIGAVLLLGVTSTLSGTLRRLAPLAAFLIFSAAYLSFFRREFLFTIPILLIGVQLTAAEKTTRTVLVRRAVLMTIALAAVFWWEYARTGSILEMRMETEIGGLVNPDETRITTALAQMYAIIERPFTGYGPGNHALAIAPYSPPDEHYLGGFNIFGWLAVEGGVLCLVSYLLVLVGVWKQAWRYRATPGQSAEAVVLRCSPVLVLQIVLWDTFGNAWDTTLAWFVMGMILAAARLATMSAEARVRVPGPSSGLRRGVRWIQQ